MICAAASGDPERLGALIEAGANPDVQMSDGLSALIKAEWWSIAAVSWRVSEAPPPASAVGATVLAPQPMGKFARLRVFASRAEGRAEGEQRGSVQQRSQLSAKKVTPEPELPSPACSGQKPMILAHVSTSSDLQLVGPTSRTGSWL